MPRKPPQHKPIVSSGVGDFLESLYFHKNRLWVFNPEVGKPMTEVNGEWMDEFEFNMAYPIKNPINFYGGKENADTSKDYLYE